MNDELEKIKAEFDSDIEEYGQHMTFAESECLYALKNYIDNRLDLLQKYIDKKTTPLL